MDKKKFEDFLIKNTFLNLIKMPELGVLVEIVRLIKTSLEEKLFLHLTQIKSNKVGGTETLMVPKTVKTHSRTTLYNFEKLANELESYVLMQKDRKHIVFVHPLLNIVFFKFYDSNKILVSTAERFMKNPSFWAFLDRTHSGFVKEELNKKMLIEYIIQSKIYDNAYINQNLIPLYNDLLAVFESISNSNSAEVIENRKKSLDLINKINTNIKSNDIEDKRYALNMYYSQFAKSKKDVAFAMMNYASKYGKTLDINPENIEEVEGLPEQEKIKLFTVFIDIIFEGLREKEKLESNEDEKEKLEIELSESIESTKQVLLEVQKLHGIIEKTSTEIYNPANNNLKKKENKTNSLVN